MASDTITLCGIEHTLGQDIIAAVLSRLDKDKVDRSANPLTFREAMSFVNEYLKELANHIFLGPIKIGDGIILGIFPGSGYRRVRVLRKTDERSFETFLLHIPTKT